MRMSLWLLVLAAMAFPAGAAGSPDIYVSPLHSSFDFSLAARVMDAPAPGASIAPAALTFATVSSGDAQYAVRVYRPRVYRPRRAPMATIPLAAQLHLGFFNPFDNFSAGFDGGFRVGPQVDPHIQLGFGMDWWHRSENTVLDLGTVQAPGGSASEKLILSQSHENLIPIMLFVQVSGDENMPVIPYAGFGAAYEWLFLTADDFVTHESFDETFGGFGWQVWAGAGLPLDWRMRVNAEVFFNGCDVGSDVDVDVPGFGPARVRDVIDVDGVGMRFGISWQF